MDSNKIWNNIINKMSINPIEVITVPSNNRTPIWFAAFMRDGKLYVCSAPNKKPASKMKGKSKVTKKDFLFVASYYERWSNGQTYLRYEVSRRSRNTAYIFGLIARFL